MAVPSTGVDLGDVHLPAYTGAPPDAEGVQWKLIKLDGWDDGWSGNGTVEQRAAADGGWATPQFAVPRLIHLEGSLLTNSWDAATLAWQRLLTQVPFRTLGEMRVSTGEGTLPEQQAMIRMHEKPVTDRLGGRVKFSLSVIAPDARRYGTDLISTSIGLPQTVGGLTLPVVLPIVINATTTGGRLTVTNQGNEPAPAILTINGPCPPATITHVGQGRRILVKDAVEAGRTLVIDTDARTAVLDGTASRTVTGTWWQLDPGLNEIAFNASSYDAAALLTIAFRSAWR